MPEPGWPFFYFCVLMPMQEQVATDSLPAVTRKLLWQTALRPYISITRKLMSSKGSFRILGQNIIPVIVGGPGSGPQPGQGKPSVGALKARHSRRQKKYAASPGRFSKSIGFTGKSGKFGAVTDKLASTIKKYGGTTIVGPQLRRKLDRIEKLSAAGKSVVGALTGKSSKVGRGRAIAALLRMRDNRRSGT